VKGSLSIDTATMFSRFSVVVVRSGIGVSQMSTSKPICGCAKKRFEERLRKIAKAPPPKSEKEEAPGSQGDQGFLRRNSQKAAQRDRQPEFALRGIC
jgi:hypothetical protein